MKNFNNTESFIVSDDIADIIDPLSLAPGEDSPAEYFCYLREESEQEHKCKISTIEKFSDDFFTSLSEDDRVEIFVKMQDHFIMGEQKASN